MQAKTVVRGERLKLGKVSLECGESMPEHVTTEREEVIICIHGKIRVRTPDRVHWLKPGEFCHVAPEVLHSVENASILRSEYFYAVAMLGILCEAEQHLH